MARKHIFLDAEFAGTWKESYQKLQYEQQKAVDKAVIAIITGKTTPGMRLKPIEPSKYYCEARINDGDRVVFRTEHNLASFVDIVPHDLINKYSQSKTK